jgi:1-acyl-sn-glycerol-3-phosphate acyltransferase
MSFIPPLEETNRVEAKSLSSLAVLAHWLLSVTMESWIRLRFGLIVVGSRKFPKPNHSFIIASNHTSFLDPPLLSSIARPRPVCYMAKQELFRKWYARAFYHFMGTFSVNREKLEIATIRSAKTILETGFWTLGIFPEGTRSLDGTVGKPKKGMAFLAKATHAPVLPVGIYRPPKPLRNIVVVIGDMMRMEGEESPDAFSDRIHGALVALRAEAESIWRQKHPRAFQER